LGESEHGLFELRMHAGDEICRDVFTQERWDLVPGAEPKAQFTRRVATGLAKIIAATSPSHSTVAVLHAAVIAELCHQATASRPFAFINAENASFTRFIIGPDQKLTLRSFNETPHLG
jgi:probable phosphoglycerate mutase